MPFAHRLSPNTQKHVISTEHSRARRLSPNTQEHVISTEGGGFAAAVKRPLYLPLPLLPLIHPWQIEPLRRLKLCAQIALVTSNPFDIGSVSVGRGRLFLIAGPCVIESETHARAMADAIGRIASDLGIPYIFKASYDKANRTSLRSFRGPGLAEGCRILRAIAQGTGLPVLTDVHTP